MIGKDNASLKSNFDELNQLIEVGFTVVFGSKCYVGNADVDLDLEFPIKRRILMIKRWILYMYETDEVI